MKDNRHSVLLSKLEKILNNKNSVEVIDFWVNDSDDGQGEEHEVIKFGRQTEEYGKEQLGIWVAPDDDFYPLTDLSDDELAELLDHICIYLKAIIIIIL